MKKFSLKIENGKESYVAPIIELFRLDMSAILAHASATGELFEIEDGGDL